MADAGFFKGTSADQDRRFSDKEMKLLKATKFPPEFDKKVDMRKVNIAVIRPWVAKKVVELIGFEDEVVIEYAMGLLEDESQPCPDPKRMQINLTGFLTKETVPFMSALWKLLLEAQDSISGVPQSFVEEKKAEMRRAREGDSRVFEERDRRARLDEIRDRERGGDRGGRGGRGGRGRGRGRGGWDDAGPSRRGDNGWRGRGGFNNRRSSRSPRRSPSPRRHYRSPPRRPRSSSRELRSSRSRSRSTGSRSPSPRSSRSRTPPRRSGSPGDTPPYRTGGGPPPRRTSQSPVSHRGSGSVSGKGRSVSPQSRSRSPPPRDREQGSGGKRRRRSPSREERRRSPYGRGGRRDRSHSRHRDNIRDSQRERNRDRERGDRDRRPPPPRRSPSPDNRPSKRARGGGRSRSPSPGYDRRYERSDRRHGDRGGYDRDRRQRRDSPSPRDSRGGPAELKIKGQASARASGSRGYDDEGGESRSPSPGGSRGGYREYSRSPSPRARGRAEDDEGMDVDRRGGGEDNEEERLTLARKESELKEKALRNKVMKSRKTSSS